MKKSYPKEVFLNSQWLPHEQATVSVFDRGFLFGDGIYEVIPFYQHRLFTLDEHIQRLQDGLDEVGIDYDAGLLKSRAEEAAVRLGCEEGIVYLQVTRGVAPRTHYFPADVQPTVLLYASPFSFRGFEQKLVDVVLSDEFRWQRCDIKSISLMANVLTNNAAHEMDVTENIFAREGLVTEGSHTSVFFVKDNVVYTHPNGSHILPGITRKLVIALCEELGVEVREEAVAAADLSDMDEAFLTGTTMQVTAIGAIWVGENRLVLGKGEVGAITHRIQEAFIARVAAG